MVAHDPEERSLLGSRARNIALSRQSPDQRRAHVQPAIDAQRRALEDEVDPDRVLDPEDRADRVTALRRARMAELSVLALRAKRGRAASRVGAA